MSFRYIPNERLRKTPKRQHYYHVSENRLAYHNTVTLYPLDSEDMNGRGDFEPNNARICVGPTIPHCFSAICHQWLFSKVYIYRTVNKVLARYPYDVSDSRITREKWLIHPTKFILIHTICPKINHWPKSIPCGDGSYGNLQAQLKYMHKAKTILEDMGITS